MPLKYRRILLKLSGEALGGAHESGIDPVVARAFAADIKEICDRGVQVGIVVGGGNFFRGAQGCTEILRTTGDTIGMLATVMNSLALGEFLRALGVPCRLFTAVSIEKAGELFSANKACKALEDGEVVIIGGGTGNPFFTTDTAAALRAAEIGAEVLCKATKVDGMYDADPVKNPLAKKFEKCTFADAISRNLKVMDATAFSFCNEQNIPIIVFKMSEAGNLSRVVNGEPVGSLITR